MKKTYQAPKSANVVLVTPITMQFDSASPQGGGYSPIADVDTE